MGSAAGELLEKVPIIGGSAKYGSSLFGIAGEWADILPEAGEKFSASLDWNKLTPKQKAAFKKADEKQRPKPKTMAEDKAWDKKKIAQIKKKIK